MTLRLARPVRGLALAAVISALAAPIASAISDEQARPNARGTSELRATPVRWSRSKPIAASTGATPASAPPACSHCLQSARALRSPLAIAPARVTTPKRPAEKEIKMTSALRVFAALALLAAFAPAAQAMEFSPWAPAVMQKACPVRAVS